MSFITEAHSRLLAKLAALNPADMPMYPTSEDFDDRAEHVNNLKSLLVEYLHALATDGKSNATTNSINSEVAGYVSDALSDFAGQFTEEADSLREDEPSRSDFQEHNTHNYAASGAR